ncbi:type 1 fimbrial protein [Achromobacter sp. K91]|jgi:type 1 fimbria pilin|nr:type 1 fimbrial protein [Achromobacter sp. K91]CAB3813602.1 hypothetical protein LMG26854_00834 [Achromobacter aegrifaciens]
MNTFRILFLLGATLLSLVYSPANAAGDQFPCEQPHFLGIVLPATIELNADVGVGQVMWSGTVGTRALIPGRCASEESPPGALLIYLDVYEQNGVFNTGIPGVGARIKSRYRSCVSNYWPTECETVVEGTPPKVTIEYELIKTGNVGSGSFGCCEDIAFWTFGSTQNTYARFRYAGTTTVRVRRPPTCSFSSNDTIHTSLGVVSKTVFKGIGSTSAERPFKIDLSCKGGDGLSSLDVYATLTDATKPGNRSKVLNLSPGSGATGVGVEILNGTTVLGYGADSNVLGNPGQWKAGTVSPGASVFSIPLTARYVQTDEVVTVGTANARATFTMSYQ